MFKKVEIKTLLLESSLYRQILQIFQKMSIHTLPLHM